MNRTFLVLLALSLLLVPVVAYYIFPNIDIVRYNQYGELITVFSPHGFYFSGDGFSHTVRYFNGTAIIGKRQ